MRAAATEEQDLQRLGFDLEAIAAWERKALTASHFAGPERVRWERELTRAMEAAMTESFRMLRKRLLAAKGVFRRKEQPDEILRDDGLWDQIKARLLRAYMPILRRVANGAAQYNIEHGLAVDMDFINQRVLEFSRTYINDWWRELDRVTRAGLRQAIVNWQETGLGARGLPDLVDAIEPLFGTARAERIAVTEVTRIFDEGNRLAHEAAGIEYEQWQTANDDRVEEQCAALEGRVFLLNDGPRPPLHVHCRCARLPLGAAEGERLLGR